MNIKFFNLNIQSVEWGYFDKWVLTHLCSEPCWTPGPPQTVSPVRRTPSWLTRLVFLEISRGTENTKILDKIHFQEYSEGLESRRKDTFSFVTTCGSSCIKLYSDSLQKHDEFFDDGNANRQKYPEGGKCRSVPEIRRRMSEVIPESLR